MSSKVFLILILIFQKYYLGFNIGPPISRLGVDFVAKALLFIISLLPNIWVSNYYQYNMFSFILVWSFHLNSQASSFQSLTLQKDSFGKINIKISQQAYGISSSASRERHVLDCPRSGPGPVRALFADPGPGPQVQVQSFSDLDLDTSTAVYWLIIIKF